MLSIIGRGPWMMSYGCVPHRIVLRRSAEGAAREYVTHLQSVHEDGSVSHEHGCYFQDDLLSAARSFAERIEKYLKSTDSVITDDDMLVWVSKQSGLCLSDILDKLRGKV